MLLSVGGYHMRMRPYAFGAPAFDRKASLKLRMSGTT